MSHSFVNAQIRAHVSDILSCGPCSKTVERTRALYVSFTQPGLDRVLDQIGYAGQVVRDIAKANGII